MYAKVGLKATHSAQRACRKLCNKSAEHLEILAEDGRKLTTNKGNNRSVNAVTHSQGLVGVHNHPTYKRDGVKYDHTPLNVFDLGTCLHSGLKKAYAATPKGYFAMDFSNMNIPVNKALDILHNSCVEWIEKSKNIKKSIKDGLISFEEATIKDFKNQRAFNKDFAKKYHCTYSEVLWDDFKALKGKNINKNK